MLHVSRLGPREPGPLRNEDFREAGSIGYPWRSAIRAYVSCLSQARRGRGIHWVLWREESAEGIERDQFPQWHEFRARAVDPRWSKIAMLQQHLMQQSFVHLGCEY